MKCRLSAILVSRGPFSVVRSTVRRLAMQEEAAEIELILVGTLGPLRVPAGECQSFGDFKVLQLRDRSTVSDGNAAGVRIATTSVVVFCEDHCFPEPGWAKALLAAHAEDVAAVGPVFLNANPRNAVSCCDFLVGYSPFMEPCEKGPRPFLPGHNCSYKKAELLLLGDSLEGWLEAETLLHFEMRKQGKKLMLEPAARVSHLNFALFPVWLLAMFYGGRVFGASRALGFSPLEKAIFTVGSPAIAPLRFWRCARAHMGRGGALAQMVSIAPLLLVGLSLDAAGQMLGYAFGFGTSRERVGELEANRVKYILDEDREALERAAG